MAIISLSQKNQKLHADSFDLDNQIVFNYFNKLPAPERDEAFLKAIYIGVLALMEDRLSAFLAKTSNHLGTELENLKIIFDLKQELFFKSSMKGALAEEDIAEYLTNFFSENRLNDRATLTGNTTGKLPRNKTGDIVCNIDNQESLKIVIECKFDKSLRLGDIASKDIFGRKSDTAWSQLLEAKANREGKVSIVVLDTAIADAALLKVVQNVRFIPAVGFIVLIDSQRSDYSNLAIAYMLARDVAINATSIELDKDVLGLIINRILKDIADVMQVRALVTSNIENNKKILSQLEKGLASMTYNQKILTKFLEDGQMTSADLLEFYVGEGARDEYRIIEQQLNEL